ncbi:major capsid protein [Cellulosilyticum sp. WCF-2]|uniref:major capsid protein n=1 Tax=Cellulosilyticum sp. WCF-2 TaxID=2497860 RepID=UPI000F8DDD8A|nr:major capsid protein [Cellulosilyticum sp. WCF-2]QEH67270.1 major capsid protein [Cellulosilyticum sp. WCF-2]
MTITTRAMLQALDLRKPMRSFFTGFFPNSQVHIEELLEIETKKGKRLMAPFVSKRKGGKLITRAGYSSKLIKAPKIAPERMTTADDISQKTLGENIYSGKTPAQRSREILASDLSELEEYILRRKEWMCREIILNGKIDIQDEDEGLDIQIDYQFDNKETLSGEAKWNTSTAKILEDLTRWRRAVIKKTGKAPRVLLMASDVYQLFKQNSGVQKELNILNLKTADITPRVIDPALTFLGRIIELDLDVYCYDEWFVDDDGEEQPMLPEGHVLLLPEVVGSIEYSAVSQIEGEDFVTYDYEMVPKFWVDNENERKMLRMTSRPVPRPYDVDGWYVAVVK